MSDWHDLEEKVIDRQMCCLCGTCMGICPAQTLEFRDGRIQNAKDLCVHCGRCLAVCPGQEFDYPDQTMRLFRMPVEQVDPVVGHYRSILKGYATDDNIRAHAASGGAVTALGCFMLERGYVDAVVGVTGTAWEHPVRLLKTRDEVLEAMQSKYVFVPVNQIIRDILERDGRYLYVGLPCQVQGLRKAMEQNRILQERIVLCAGIFCGFNMTDEATEFLASKSGIPREEIDLVEYRGRQNGQTGFHIHGAQKDFFVTKHGYTLLNAFYSRPRCWKCYDLTAEFSDLSFGDAWEMGIGWSRILCRTPLGEQIIREMDEHGKLTVEHSSAAEVYSASRKIIAYKKRTLGVRQKHLKNFPDYHVELPQVHRAAELKVSLFLACLRLGNTRVVHAALKLMPMKLLAALSEMGRSDTLQEMLRYGFWGITTPLVSFFSYWVFLVLGLDYRLANLLSMLMAKSSAYFVNKFFVFHSKQESKRLLLREIGLFILTRAFSGLIEFVGLVILVDLCSIGRLSGKLIMIVIITIINYFWGKNIVFKG